MFIFGICVAVLLPTYVLHRVRTNDGVTQYVGEIEELVHRHGRELLELHDALIRGNMRDNFLLSVTIEELRALAEQYPNNKSIQKIVNDYIIAKEAGESNEAKAKVEVDEEDVKYINEGRVTRLKELAQAMEDSTFTKEAVMQYLDAIKEELLSTSSSLFSDFADIRLKRSGII